MIRHKKLLTQILFSNMFVLFGVLLLIVVYSTNVIREIYYNQTVDSLKNEASLIGNVILQDSNMNLNQLDSFCKTIGLNVNIRITIIQPNGMVACDSGEDAFKMDNHASRPEVVLAIQDGVGVSKRYSNTKKYDMIYVARLIYHNDKTFAIIRTSKPLVGLSGFLHKQYVNLIIYGLFILILGLIVSYLIAMKINRPLKEVLLGLKQFVSGNLNYRLKLNGAHEIVAVAKTINEMAMELGGKLNTIKIQKDELEIVLSSMIESVIVLNEKSEIVSINKAGADLLGVNREDVAGKKFADVVDINSLIHFINNIYSTQKKFIEDEIHLKSDKISLMTVKCYGSKLCSEDGKCGGILAVLNDVSKIRQLENVRREFVANVSHELLTPVTSIKGFIETLKDGALEDKENAEKFLDIIYQQTERLRAIIEDLLNLSRIEQESEYNGIDLVENDLFQIVKTSVEACRTRASDKQIYIDIIASDSVIVKSNKILLEQAFTNLVDNAIKYSDSNANININIKSDDAVATIIITDKGYGIPKEHLLRIFERFYRVDKARSRKMGGTGLGLSIVKHIIQAHGGTVSVESEVGVGSSFIVKIPIK